MELRRQFEKETSMMVGIEKGVVTGLLGFTPIDYTYWLEGKLKNVAKPEGDSRSDYPQLSDVRASVRDVLQSMGIIKDSGLWFKYDGWENNDSDKIRNFEKAIKLLCEHFR